MRKRTVKKCTKKRGSTNRRKSARKPVRKTTKRIISGDKIYQVINKVQTLRKPCDFAVSLEDTEVVKNIIEDTGLKVSTRQSKDRVVFKVSPGKIQKDELDEESIEENIFNDILGE